MISSRYLTGRLILLAIFLIVTSFEIEPIEDHRRTVQADPCELLSDDLLKAHFEIGDAQISRSPSSYSPHPLCTVTWPKSNATEIEAENEKNLMDYMKAKMQGNDEEAAKLRKRATNEVSLTINKDDHESREAASAAFDSAMRILNEGMTITVDGEETTTPTYETVPVIGVGDKAAWAAGLNQLSVQSGTKIFHVGVILGRDKKANLAKAKDIAGDLAEILK